MMKKEKKAPVRRPKVHPELGGFNIHVNSFGEVVSNLNIDRINSFLNKTVEDKKLVSRDDWKR